LKPTLAFALLSLAAASFAGAAGTGPVRLQKMTFRGWSGCYALSAGPYRVVVAPAIGGRIVDYSRSGLSPIWLNAEETGKVHPTDPKVWRNYGGYKTWPAPQSRWGWPPDPLLDAAPATVRPWMRSGKLFGLEIIGQDSPQSGIAFVKYLHLDPASGALSLRQEMHALASDPNPVRWAVWSVTQVDGDGRIVAPLNPKSRHAGGVYFYDPRYRRSLQWKTKEGLLIVKNLGEAGKWGLDANGGWMAWLKGRLAYVKRFPAREPGADYPDESSNVQIWTNPAPLHYSEMELTGPIRDLEPGSRTVLEEEWRLVALPHAVSDEAGALSAVRFLREKGLLKPLSP
jgi:hypothetical protein